MIIEAFGCIAVAHREQCEAWFRQEREDVEITEQLQKERLRPGDRVWCDTPPSMHVPKLSPGDTFDERIVDSGEGPVACCTVRAIYLSKRRWIVYWTSGECYGVTRFDEIQPRTIVRTCNQDTLTTSGAKDGAK